VEEKVYSIAEHQLGDNMKLRRNGNNDNDTGWTSWNTWNKVVMWIGAIIVAALIAVFIWYYFGERLKAWFLQLRLVAAGQSTEVPAEFRRLGDINGDGLIDEADMNILQKSINTHAGDANWNQAADLNNDGVVDVLDAIILSNHKGLTLLSWKKRSTALQSTS
jgi:hypothetical protein